MTVAQLRSWSIALLAGCALALEAAPAAAQFFPGTVKKPTTTTSDQAGGNSPVTTIPGVNIPQQNSNLTPEQMQLLIQSRMLQQRSRGQVRSGVPQFIPLGSPGAGMPQFDMPAEQPSSTTKAASNEKKAAARKAAEEKKRATREAAKAKAKDKDAKAKGKGAKPAKAVKPKDGAKAQAS